MKFDVCVDVDDVERAVTFYGKGLGLEIVKQESEWAQLALGEHTFWIMKIPAGAQGEITRDYQRHWTPIHLDFVVDDLDSAVKRAVSAGGRLESRSERGLANLADPSGNGVDLVQRKPQ